MRTSWVGLVAVFTLAACTEDATPGKADASSVLDVAAKVDTPAVPDAATGDSSVEPVSCGATQPGDPCGTEGAECNTTTDWCGSKVTTFGCHCKDAGWQCFAAGAPLDCHECCQDLHGAMYYCQNGTCLEGAGCKAVDCCLPGAEADSGCQGSYGECSTCGVVSGHWRCTPTECDGTS